MFCIEHANTWLSVNKLHVKQANRGERGDKQATTDKNNNQHHSSWTAPLEANHGLYINGVKHVKIGC